jgi:hypoxanthine phosphoribosyltransferase
MGPNPKFEAPSWDEIYSMMLRLARRIRESRFNPEVIVGVSRGEWPPARIMSDLLENQNLANMKVVFYRDIGLRNERPIITQPVSSRVKGKRVLVVDDVSDTGHSLRVVSAHHRAKGAGKVKVCTLYLKPRSVFTPHYYAKKTSKWIIFPWERLESIRLLSKKLGDRQVSVARIVSELRDSGLNPDLIRRLMVLGSDSTRH